MRLAAAIIPLLAIELLCGCEREDGRLRPAARKTFELSDLGADPAAGGSGGSSAAAAPAGKGIVKGKVTYTGPKAMKEINMTAVGDCHKQHDKPVFDEMIVASEKGELANVVVYVKEGPSLNGPVPRTPAMLDQRGCVYYPHVLPMMVGQEFRIRNSDAFLHNVHGLAKDNGEFNFPQASKGDEKKVDANKTVETYRIKCDVHPWMGVYVVVLDHPFFAASKADGSFEITGLPAGNYTLVFWHEKLPAQELAVTVSEAKPAEVTATFK